MMLMSTRRWKALRWYADNAIDASRIADQRPPSRTMWGRLMRAGLLRRALPPRKGYEPSDLGWQTLRDKGRRGPHTTPPMGLIDAGVA
jgi:hypothetical protein